MNIATLATIFAAGFVVMTPVGPVSTICIRRSLCYGRGAGIAAGAGNAVAVAAYATMGVAGGTFLPHVFAPFATIWHLVIAIVLAVVALLIWQSKPVLPNAQAPTQRSLAAGFGATLALALANPADIVLFAVLFTGLGVVVQTPLQHVLFYGAVFAGGCAYWIALALVLDRWRAGLTPARMIWLNRTCAAMMLVGAAVSLVSLARGANGS